MMTLLEKLTQPNYVKHIHSLNNREVIEYLSEDNSISEDEVCQILSNFLQYNTVYDLDLTDCTPDFKIISIENAASSASLYIKSGINNYLLVCNPFSTSQISFYQTKYGSQYDLSVHICPTDLFDEILENYIKSYSTLTLNESLITDISQNSTVENISLDSIHDENNEIIKIVNSIIFDSLKQKASDIHVEIRDEDLFVFYRIDGSLINVMNLRGRTYTEQVISRIKILANLDISENRIPQDGRIKLSINNKLIDFRVSIMPSIYGEDAVLRVLDGQRLSKNRQKVTLGDLNFPQLILDVFKKMLVKKNGMILITGPTGSGKTTTLYAMIDEIRTGLDKIITIEDPIEYALDGVLQIPVNEKKGLTFAKGLRSILRHDPDVIMVGEIRDNETAQIAVQAALTGHLVFTTVHANNVFNVLSRFRYMDVDKFGLVSALNCIVSQGLIKLLCSNCKVIDKDYIKNDITKIEQKFNTTIDLSNIRKAVGCSNCFNTGYQKRTPINEVLVIDDVIRTHLINQDDFQTLKKYALQHDKWIPNTIQLFNLLNRGLIDLKQFMSYID